MFKQYTDLVIRKITQSSCAYGLKYAENPIPLEEVESVDEIVKHFKTGACPMVPFLRKHMRHLLLQ